MQPNDQDELRKQAQRVLARRISAEQSTSSQPSLEERPRQTRQPRPVRRPEQPRRRRTEESPARRPAPVETGPLLIETIESPDAFANESQARIERQSYARDNQNAFEQSVSTRRASGIQRNQIQRALKSRAAIRQAIVINEILGKPVSLRGPGSSDSFGGI